MSFLTRTVEQIDRDLRDALRRRRAHTGEISRLSGLVVSETGKIADLLDERHHLTNPPVDVPDTPADIDKVDNRPTP